MVEGSKIRCSGFPLSARMIDMGVVGMVEIDGEWLAQFDRYPGVQFPLPKPVADYLMEEE